MRLASGDYLILSCEHGGNRLPAPFRHLFTKRFLSTHRGYDPGALALARDFAAATRAPLFYSTVTRLLVELNRPLGHPQVFSKNLPPEVREKLLREYYFPYWRSVEGAVRRTSRRVLHISFHSFTPKLRGERRTTDVGLLFDPARPAEVEFCRRWRSAILKRSPRLRVRYNDPYQGTFPSLVDSLRKKLGRRYVGIQIEINQKFPRGNAARWRRLRALLRMSFADASRRYRPRAWVGSASRSPRRCPCPSTGSGPYR